MQVEQGADGLTFPRHDSADRRIEYRLPTAPNTPAANTNAMARSMNPSLLAAIALLLALVRPWAAVAQSEDQPLLGDFAVTIATDDVPPDLIDGASLVGRWQISFNADGTYARARQDVGTLASGHFQIDGDR